MTNNQVAAQLREIAAAYEIKGENRFKIIAYERAADIIEQLTSEVKDVWEEGKLQTIPGIGLSMAAHLDELFKRGSVKHFDKVKKGLPEAMFALLPLPNFGAKRAYKLAKILRLRNRQRAIMDLKKAAMHGEIAKVEGFGDKSQKEILDSILKFEKKEVKLTRMLLPYAENLAYKIIEYLVKNKDVIKVYPLGSLRRMAATVGDIDIAVATNNSKDVIEYFLKYRGTKKILNKGDTIARILVQGGRQIDLMVQSPNSFGALLQHFTGSKQHNIHLREYALKRGLSLSEYGIKESKNSKLLGFDTEEKFYAALGLEWIPPEIRENTGEIEMALKEMLPTLVDYNQIRGDLHVHSDYNIESSHDLGKSRVEEILREAQKLNYEYLGFTDHNPSYRRHSINDILTILKRRKSYYDQIKCSNINRVKLLLGLEIDILPSGDLAVPNQYYEYIDYAIIAIHSSFNLDKAAMTQRVIRAMKYPKIKLIAHPTGRLLQKREGYELSWTEIFHNCKKLNVALEINAYADRLDLPDTLVREAIKNNVKLMINTDAHEVGQMNLMRYGIAVARRGWASESDILNTLSYNQFIKFIKGGN